MLDLLTMTTAEHDAWVALKEGDAVQFDEEAGYDLPDGVVDGDSGRIMSIDVVGVGGVDDVAYVEVPTSPYRYVEVNVGCLVLAGEHPAGP